MPEAPEGLQQLEGQGYGALAGSRLAIVLVTSVKNAASNPARIGAPGSFSSQGTQLSARSMDPPQRTLLRVWALNAR